MHIKVSKSDINVVFCFVRLCFVMSCFFCDIGFDDDLDKRIVRNDENNFEKIILRILTTSLLT